MMGLAALKAELRQEMKLTPQLLQSMEILQMNSQELLDHLNRITEENPLVEQEDSHRLRSAYEDLRQKASWIDGGVYGATFTHDELAVRERGGFDKETESLTAFLCDQLERKRLPKPLLALSKYMAELVDEDGYLSAEDLDELSGLNIPQALVEQAMETLQSLEPAGVGARTLSECLLLQLGRQGGAPPFVLDIVTRFLPELGRKHYGPIRRELGLTMKEIQSAEKMIAGLEPYPGRAFQPAEPAAYVRPDIFIVELDGEWKAILNEYYLPQIQVSDYYVHILKESDEKETREYLHQKLQQARWLLHSLERRGATLRRCADAILEAQRPFFSGQTGSLAPMGLSSLAKTLELHPSTVSRAVRGKYLQCRKGTYPLRYFFSRAVGGGASRQSIQQRLLELIRGEDPRHPLSDQTLCGLLSAGGTEIARRTVAKYRLELGIGSSAARKYRHRR